MMRRSGPSKKRCGSRSEANERRIDGVEGISDIASYTE